MASDSVCAYYVVSLVHLRHYARYLVRRVLQVCVKCYRYLPAYLFKACHYCHVLSEVSVKVYNSDFRIILIKIVKNPKASVSASVIDEEDLKRAVHPLHNRVEFAEKRIESLLLVIYRYYYRYLGSHYLAASKQISLIAQTTSRASSSVIAGKRGSETILSETYSASGREPRDSPVISPKQVKRCIA